MQLNRVILFYLISLIFSQVIHAQKFGNEWIKYNQDYLTFKVAKKGLYRIDYTTLQSSGIPVNTLKSQNIQLFGREREIPLVLIDSNGIFDSNDAFYFYGEGNDGWLDSTLYDDPNKIVNPGYSLINDTLHYFITWNATTDGLRYKLDSDSLKNGTETLISYLTRQSFSSASNSYSEGRIEGRSLSSFYDDGEGYGFTKLSTVSGFSTQLNIPIIHENIYSKSAPSPELKIISSTNSNIPNNGNANHHTKITIGKNNHLVLDTLSTGFKRISTSKIIPITALDTTTNKTELLFSIVKDLGLPEDTQTLTYWHFKYPTKPQVNDLSTVQFYITPSSQRRLLVLKNNFNTAKPLVLFQQGNIVKQLVARPKGLNEFEIILPGSNSTHTIQITVGFLSFSTAITNIQPVTESRRFTDYSKINKENSLLVVSTKNLASGVSKYIAYRRSVDGGKNLVISANVEELYLQFGGGIEKHIAGIRRYVHYIYKKSNNKPIGLFLIGKGIDHATFCRANTTHFRNNLVPSFGYPASDVAITAGLEGTEWDPLIPTGRFSCTTNKEIEDYLNKIIAYEKQQRSGIYTSATKDWQKQVMHFVGGNSSQQEGFRAYMDNLATFIADTAYAGTVHSYYKSGSTPFNPAIINEITSRIADGTSLMTFFAHAGTNGGFEINVDDPTNWNNKDKYPFIIGISCFSGDLFSPGVSYSERVVRLADEGAIAFLASTKTGYDAPLYEYSLELYKQMTQKSYGLGLGEQIRRAIRSNQFPSGMSALLEANTLQMAFHGDPLLKLNSHEKPEIEVQKFGTFITPKDITLDDDSVQVNIVLKNLGRAIRTPFLIEVTRDFPGSAVDSIYRFKHPSLVYMDTIRFSMPLQPTISAGLNTLTIRVDIPNAINEMFDETENNFMETQFDVKINGIVPVYPYNYAVVPSDTISVKASTIDPLLNLKTYKFELDTTPFYNSPLLRRASVIGIGGTKVVSWKDWKSVNGTNSPLILKDSVVYFWRVALDSSKLSWKNSSFQYIKGKTGWGQAHFMQQTDNEFLNIEIDSINRKRIFPIASPHTIYIKAYDNPTPNNEWGLNGGLLDYANLFVNSPGLYVGVIDPVTVTAWSTYCPNDPTSGGIGMDFGNFNTNCVPRKRAERFFAFAQNDKKFLSSFENMIRSIPDGHYVAIYTTVATRYSDWNTLQPSLFQLFQEIGSTKVKLGQPEKPFALIFKKGDKTSIIEKHWPETSIDGGGSPYLNVELPIIEKVFQGVEISPFIGPAKKWNSIYWKRDSLELIKSDSVRLSILGYSASKSLITTIDTVFTPTDSIIDLSTFLSGQNYPFIKLKGYYHDDAFFTPGQLKRWHVLYDEVPEAAIQGDGFYLSNNQLDTLLEGQEFSISVGIKNISPHNMDSLLVKYTVYDEFNVPHPIKYPRQDRLLSGKLLKDTVLITTKGLNGFCVLEVEANPYIDEQKVVTDQLEQYHFNNIIQIPIKVVGDLENPILDVTFNGRKILNGDIVEPNSEIQITLKDENDYLIMDSDNDTIHFGVYLTTPNGIQKRIPFVDGSGRTIMQWIPATNGNKKFKIIFPNEFADGKYTLTVQGTDKSGNSSGDFAYKIDFEVVRTSSISYLMNYPNPFSTKTQFVFTLTGVDLPDRMLIQIMNINGKIVREIDLDELGPMHIGRNITSYAWDGKDQFGDPLANGVYLYTVRASIAGKAIEHRQTNADNYFTKSYGKMYLMR